MRSWYARALRTRTSTCSAEISSSNQRTSAFDLAPEGDVARHAALPRFDPVSSSEAGQMARDDLARSDEAEERVRALNASLGNAKRQRARLGAAGMRLSGVVRVRRSTLGVTK